MLTLEHFQDWYSRRDALKKLPRRPLVLLAAAWAYRTLPIFERQYPDDNRPRQAIRAATQWAVEPTKDNQQKAAAAANAAYYAAYYAATAAASAAYYAATAAASAAYAANAAANAADYNADADIWPWLYETYQCCLGEGREWSPEWTTPETVAIARKCILELDKGDLPYLADALEDAGYPHEADLERLRSGRCEWSDWCVWNVLC